MEDACGVWHHLLRLGLHVHFHSGRRPCDASADLCGAAVLHGGTSADGVDDGAARTVANGARVGLDLFAGSADLRGRLRVAVLGGAEGAVRNCGCDDGDDSGVHCDGRGAGAAHGADDGAAWRGVADWRCGCGRADEPVVAIGHGADQHRGSGGADCGVDLLVGGVGDYAEIARCLHRRC